MGAKQKKYLIAREIKGKREYKKYKCIDGWDANADDCWAFSKPGAIKICQRFKEGAEKSKLYQARPELKPSYFILRRHDCEQFTARRI